MAEEPLSGQRGQSMIWFVIFLACGMVVFVVFSHYFPIFSGPTDFIGRIVVALAFLAATLLFRRSERYRTYWRICFTSFTALAAISLDYYLGLSKWLLPALHIPLETPVGLAIDKLESSALSILVVLLLIRVSGDDLASLYLRRGNLRLGLTIGLVAFAMWSG